MTSYHYRAELIAATGERWEYRYYPDHLADPATWGVFAFDPLAGSWSEVRSAGAREAAAHRCISALAHKLRKFPPADAPPDVVAFIA